MINFLLGQFRYGSCLLLTKVAPRPSDETLNRCMHLCTHAFKFMHGLRRTWMTSESIGVQKHTDGASMQKSPENGMWLPMGGQIENCHVRIPS